MAVNFQKDKKKSKVIGLAFFSLITTIIDIDIFKIDIVLDIIGRER